jgi:hypothetical protein
MRFPEDLPQQFQQTDFQDMEPDIVLHTKTDSGIPKMRKRYTAAIRKLAGRMSLDMTQKATLQDFYLDNCGSRFFFPDPDTGADLTVFFLEKPQFDFNNSFISVDVRLSFGVVP